MKRLRHPVRAIREPFGTAGLVVACVALIAALGGTALAAAKLNSTQKKEVEKIAKKFAGKPGAQGPTGPQGPAGANGKDGAQGLQGEKGPKGDTGSAGATGQDGKSVQVDEIVAGTEGCNELGGAEVKVQGAGTGVEVCNGEKGAQGEEGNPWTLNGKLPVGATETGSWELSDVEGPAGKLIWAPISFAIPVAGGLNEQHVHFQTEANFTDFDEEGPGTIGCKGNVQLPSAPSGHLCVYRANPIVAATFLAITNFGRGGSKLANETGALLEFERKESEEGEYPLAAGSFAVTG